MQSNNKNQSPDSLSASSLTSRSAADGWESERDLKIEKQEKQFCQ